MEGAGFNWTFWVIKLLNGLYDEDWTLEERIIQRDADHPQFITPYFIINPYYYRAQGAE